jgi:polyisoprenoid-binding protein YceI
MKKYLIPFIITAALIFSSFGKSEPVDYKLTDGYSVRFVGKKANGFFHKLKGEVKFDENNLPASKVRMEVDVASISLGNSLKTWHAKRPRWFNVKKYPTITFVSNRFQKTAKGLVVSGKLKMRGVEKDISVPFSFSNNIFFGHFSVRRTDFKVGTMKGLSKMVSDTIRIDFTIPVTK